MATDTAVCGTLLLKVWYMEPCSELPRPTLYLARYWAILELDKSVLAVELLVVLVTDEVKQAELPVTTTFCALANLKQLLASMET